MIASSHPESQRALSDVVVDMGLIEESCPLGLTPTASTAVVSAITAPIEPVLMQKSGTTKRPGWARPASELRSVRGARAPAHHNVPI